MDKLHSDFMSIQNEMMMDTQFRAGSNKLLSDKQNEKVKISFFKMMEENFRYQEILKNIRNKLESGYLKGDIK